MAIDEMMIPFKGWHDAKMCMPKKPVKWGYRMWCRAGISGYICDFEVCVVDFVTLATSVWRTSEM